MVLGYSHLTLMDVPYIACIVYMYILQLNVKHGSHAGTLYTSHTHYSFHLIR